VVDVMQLWKTVSRTGNQLGGLIRVASMVSRNREELFSEETLNLLVNDSLARKLLFADLDLLEAGVKELRAELTARGVSAKAGE
jgi:hypothetical protein